ncbi:UNVERIFIED_CONTAM: G-type lectin S-receptor-like serine/threonine-protein kinase [Sesamum radiatum]|uniref:G-type lectin S-receptor-like serine/threonine-protein kinase n=1 Tax=Sesamum radiatum TaxID=300843 RepID=A0AAW2KG90_SESRA
MVDPAKVSIVGLFCDEVFDFYPFLVPLSNGHSHFGSSNPPFPHTETQWQWDIGCLSIVIEVIMKLKTPFHALYFFFISRLFFKLSIAVDSISPNQTLLDNGTTLVSRNGTFELGFFSPWSSNNRYLGIWFKKVPEQTVVWVANKDDPVVDLSGTLAITPSGNIIITRNQSNIVWTANSPSTTVSSPVLKLLDNGNLVLTNSTAIDDDPEVMFGKVLIIHLIH